MPTYKVYFRTSAEASVTVTADDEDAALDAAYDVIPDGVCAQCSGWGKKWWIELGQWEATDDAWPAVPGYPSVVTVDGGDGE